MAAPDQTTLPRSPAPGRRQWLPWLFVCIAGVIAFSWPALANRQPFFFPDTTAYVRAGDMIVNLGTGGAITSDWTAHYSGALKQFQSAKSKADAPPASVTPTVSPTKAHTDARLKGPNDVANGNIMSGRSPYFGLLIYLTDLVSSFWLFVLLCSALTLYLVYLTLRAFEIRGWKALLGVAGLLAALTTLPFYTSYLLTDIFAALGILAALLIVTAPDRFSRVEIIALFLIALFAAASHLTHVVTVVVMLALALVLAASKLLPRGSFRGTAVTGAALALLGGGSIVATDLVIEHVFKRRPQLLPLLTARFVADGPGADYMRSDCDGRFIVCRYTDRLPMSATDFLWSGDARNGVYTVEDFPVRQALSEQDKAFAISVLQRYPARQLGRIAYNTADQALRFDSRWLNDVDREKYRRIIPARHVNAMQRTLSWNGAWPVNFITILHRIVAGLSLALVLAASVAFTRMLLSRTFPAATEPDRLLRLCLSWTVLILFAFLVNAFLGGALSESQNRYQGRIIWLLPLLAIIHAVVWQRLRAGSPTAQGFT